MRLAILVPLVLPLVLAASAEARPPRRYARAIPRDPDRGDFWRDMLEPHADEVRRIVFLARSILSQADQAQYGDYDPTGEQRARFYREAYGMISYAHRLAPDNLEVLRLYAQTADALGKTRQATSALEAAVRIAGPDQAGPEITGRLGSIYLRLGRLDDAIHYLRLAQQPVVAQNPTSARVLVDLSTALAARGEMSDAIDVLANALPQNVPFYSNEVALVGFALAVQYDRDDQRSAAFEVLDRMQSSLQAQQYANEVQTGLALMRWATPEDQHYYQALLYESMGHYTEARAEWALYAEAGNLPFRARALEHIAAIDAQRRTRKPRAAGAPGPVPPPVFP